MDCGLQAMAEEDEDIDFYNNETFGMGEEPGGPFSVPFSVPFSCDGSINKDKDVQACVFTPLAHYQPTPRCVQASEGLVGY